MTGPRAGLILLPIIYLGFISLGLPDGTFGVAWPQAHATIGAPVGLGGTIIAVATLLSAVSGFSSGLVIGRFSTGPVVFVSCLLTGGALLMIAHAPGMAWLLIAAAPLGLGAGAVDAGLNGYVARHYTARHMNWLHACWGIGATTGPLVLTHAIETGAGWRHGYLLLGLTQLSLAFLFLATLALWRQVPERTAPVRVSPAGLDVPEWRANSTVGWLSVGIFALYAGVEITAGVWAGSILALARGIPLETAGLCTAAYYGSIMGGRVAVGFVAGRWSNRAVVAAGSGLAFTGAVLFGFADTPLSAGGSLVLLGLGFAPVYPGLMHEVPQRFAPESVQVVIGRQSGGACLGAASLPALAGLAPHSLEIIPWLVVGGVVLLAALIRRLDRLS